MLNDSTTGPVPRPAATVMLVRDGRGGLEVFLARRSSKARFMPGAYVFPGGAVDEADRRIAARGDALGLANVGDVDGAFAIAALRETFEEAGLLLAAAADGSPLHLSSADLTELRAAVAAGGSLDELLRARGAVYDARGLAHYSNWVTPVSEPLRFDTHFFAAPAPPDQIAAADAQELHDGRWLAASDALERAARGELTIIFPTLKHLERIAAHASAAEFLAHARARFVSRVMPVFDGGRFELLADPSAW